MSVGLSAANSHSRESENPLSPNIRWLNPQQA